MTDTPHYPQPGESVGSVAVQPRTEGDLSPLSAAALRVRLAEFQNVRRVVLDFIKAEFEESEYDKDGAPVPGKLGDFYKVPGSDQKAMTKRGASKIKQWFRWGRAVHRVSGQEAKDACYQVVEVRILDSYGREWGAGIGACSTAEKRFTSAKAIQKYGGTIKWGAKGQPPEVTSPPDYRAALHDVLSSATKRADTQATIVAAAIEELFAVAEDEAKDEGEQVKRPPARPGVVEVLVLPLGKFGQYGGKAITEVPVEALVKIVDHLKAKSRDPARVAHWVEGIEAELERRRQAAADDLQGEEDLVL